MRQLLNNKQTAFIKLLTDTINKTNYFKRVQGSIPRGVYEYSSGGPVRYGRDRASYQGTGPIKMIFMGPVSFLRFWPK